MYKFGKGVQEDTKRLTEFRNQYKIDSVITLKPIYNTKNVSRLLLTESKLGQLTLTDLNDSNIKQRISNVFPEFQTNKEIGQQDGPDFNLYEIVHLDELIFLISMDAYDTNLVQTVWTENSKIKDEYGTFVGQVIDSVLVNRTELSFHADTHYNIYATAGNSRIEYRLNGNFKNLNDTTFTSNDYSVEKWQVEEMVVEYIIWRK